MGGSKVVKITTTDKNNGMTDLLATDYSLDSSDELFFDNFERRHNML
jgi:hypothetical protein